MNAYRTPKSWALTVGFVLGVAILTLPIVATQEESSWDVVRPRGTPKTIEFTVDEGTWLSVDISPDGKTLVVDLVGDIWTLPVAGGDAMLLTRASGIALNFHPRFSPDGKRVAFISDRGGAENVWIMDLDGGNPRQVSRSREDRMALPTWTPDGSSIIVRRGGDANNTIRRGELVRGRGDLWIYHTQGGEGLQLTPDNISASWPSVTPDGRFIYFEEIVRGERTDYLWHTVSDIESPAKGRYQLRRLDRQTGRIIDITRGSQEGKDGGGGNLSSGGAAAPEVSPDGRWVAFIRRVAEGTALYRGHEYGPRTALWVRDIQRGSEQIVLDPITPDAQAKGDIGPVPRYAWAPDSRSLIVAQHGKLKRAHLETGEVEDIPFRAHIKKQISQRVYNPVRLPDGPLSVRMLRWPALSPDGRLVAFQAVGRIWVMGVENGRIRRLTEASFAGHEYGPAWSPDGRWLAFTSWNDDDAGHLWKVAPDGSGLQRLTRISGEYMNATWSPDGNVIVAVQGSGATLRGRMPSENGYYQVFWIPATGGESRVIATVPGRPSSSYTVEPSFGPDGRLFYLDRNPGIELVSLRVDGADQRSHLRFRFADQAAPSPSGEWVAFQEADNVYLAALPWPGVHGDPVRLDRRNLTLPAQQLSYHGGWYPRWANETTLTWSSGGQIHIYDVRNRKTRVLSPGLEVPRNIGHGVVALQGARIITMVGDEVIERGDVLIRDGRIAALGPSGSVEIPRDAHRVALRGKTIIPGMIDVHNHLHQYADAFIPQRDWELAANLAYGVTTTLDPAAWSNIFTIAELVEAGEMTGPRVFSTGPALRAVDGPREDRIDNFEDALRLTKRLASSGARSVKEYQQPRRDQRQMTVEAARQAGLMVTCEGDGSPLHYLAIAMDGHTGCEHPILAGPIYRDITEFLGQSNTFYSITLLSSGIRPRGEDYFYQESDLWKDKKLQHFTPWRKLEPHTRHRMLRPPSDFPFPLHAQGLADVIAAGGFGGLGSHGQMPGLGSHMELWAIASAMRPLDALRVATLHGALFLGINEDVGALEPGKLADLVVLDANPLENIRNSNTVRYVMKAGRMYDGDKLDEIWPSKRPFGRFYWNQKGVRPE
jgi:Tol biopolymer transport system component